jgi:hypothetical protein
MIKQPTRAKNLFRTIYFLPLLIKNYWRPTKFRFWKLIGLEMSIWKFPRTSLGDVSLMVQKGGSFQKGAEMFILR